MNLTILLSLLLLTTLLPVKAQNTTAGRASAFCGLLDSKIYCYGGSHLRGEFFYADATMFVLDITKANEASMVTLANSWEVQPTVATDVNTGQLRYESQYVVVGGALLVVSGGRTDDESIAAIADQTIVYNVTSNSWQKYPNYMEAPYGNRQIFAAATTVVPNKGLAFYGGVEQHINVSWTMQTNQNLTATRIGGTARAIGYTRVTYLDINNVLSPWTVATNGNTGPSFFSSYQTSVFDPITKDILFFGGVYHDTLLPGYNSSLMSNWHRFSYALTFNTETNYWGNQTLTGATIPYSRIFHTTKLCKLPNGGGSTVLLYGGEGEYTIPGEPLNDYCYTLNLISFTWVQQNIKTYSVNMRRTMHSAVLINNDALFIVNGNDGGTIPTSTPIVLNISNPDSITLMETYTDPNALLITAGPKLSAGAIAGIVIGACAFIIIIITLFVVCLRRRRASRRKLEQEIAQLKAAAIENNQLPTEAVNWDEIERQYAEMTPTNPQAYQPPPSQDSRVTPDLFMKGEDDGTTLAENPARHRTGSNIPTSDCTLNSIENANRQPHIIKPDHVS